MLYKRSWSTRGRGGRGCKAGSLNRVVSKLLAKSDPSDDSILQTLLLEPQCLQSSNSICDNPVPKNPTTIPSPVINKLKKLGTSVEVEKPHTNNGQVFVPETLNLSSENPTADNIPTGYLQIMESLNKAVGLTSDLTKKKKKRAQKKTSNNQVPSTVQLLAEIENSDNLAKFSFQVDAKQVIELPEGQKLYTCDICSGVYHRGFSLKRHYLKTHINYKHISKRDLHNCGILFDPSIEKGGARKKQLIKDDSPPVVTNLSPPNDIPDLYRCHTCFKCFMLISDLQAHLMEHPPVSVQNLAEDQFKNYTCEKCKARYQKKKLFLRHMEMCIVEPVATATHFCLYCEKTFPTLLLKKKHHLQMHHPKKKLHQCYLCKTKMFKERLGVFKHLIRHHSDEYVGCLSCKLRFDNRDEYKKHNKESHKPIETAKQLIFQQKITAEVETGSIESNKSQQNDNIVASSSNPNLVLKCTECPKMFASHLNMTRHRRLAHRPFVRRRKKKTMQKKVVVVSEKTTETRKTPTPPPPVLTPPPPPPPPPPPDPEVLFYSSITHNIRENLTHHLDGKLDSQEIMEYDLNRVTATTRNKVLNFSASFTSETTTKVQPETSTPLQREPRPTPISPRAPWEKFNFPKNYDGRCGLTSYIKDMSHLDISTQLTMRRNLQRLNSTAGQESNKESPANIPAGLLLVERPGPDCAETFGEPEISKEKGMEALVLSGEWVRPRTFLCSACGYKSTNLWDVEDHKYALHPNVWVPHIEIIGEQSSSWDWFYHRRLPPETLVEETTPAAPMSPPPCSKCSRQCASLSDLHRHMLDCGGDTTWMATMLAVTSPGSRRRKWRPFGSRRRKQQGRRGLKRNIPNTPAKHSCGRIRTKPGDMDTIQKMIANLPPKRATRRVIGEDLDIKTRSQATINSVPISSIATHSSAARSASMKPTKVGKGAAKLGSQKKLKVNSIMQLEDKSRSKESVTVKQEPAEEITVKQEPPEDDFQSLEAENTVQHSDILTSLQMIPVVRVHETENVIEEPIETSKILAAMREAMMDSDEKIETKIATKTNEKKRKLKTDDRNKKSELEVKKTEPQDEDIIICNGCGMQFDNLSACQRHKKKCVYWKEDKTNEDNKTNRCVHCGSIFPYLMALLKHNCGKKEVTEELAMPELCPEQPLVEVQCDSVEEIPILSPVDISRDNVVAKRVSLLESTISEVGSESFDLSVYYAKLFNYDNSSKNKAPEKPQKCGAVATEPKTIVDSTKSRSSSGENPGHEQETSNKNVMEKQPKHLLDISGPLKTPQSSNSMLIANKVKSPVGKQGSKNNKVSDIFKEVKRRGRKRQKIKAKMAQKVLAIKTGHRKTTLASSAANTKKQVLPKKKRSSNFTMLMKEWEKLEKDGAVALGKRKRVFSNSEISYEHVRTRRRLTSANNKLDFFDIDSFNMDVLDSYDLVEPSPTRRTRRTSVGTMNNISPDILKEISEKFSSFSLENNKKEATNIEIESSKKEQTDEKVNENKHNEDDKCVSTMLNEEHDLLQNEQVYKRKPGRPRVKSISGETEKHISETIDSIVKGSLECIDSEVNTVIKDETCLTVKKYQGKQHRRTSLEQLSQKEEKDEHIKEAIEYIISENQDTVEVSEDKTWDSINNIIYNVSIGDAEIFKEELDENPCCNSSQITVKKRRGKRKRNIRKLLKSQHSDNYHDIRNFNNKGGEERKLDNSSKNKNQQCHTEKETADCSNVENPSSVLLKNNSDIADDKCEKSLPQPTPKVTFTFSEGEMSSPNNKPKEIKTKQLSIANYLSISNYAKKSSELSSLKTKKECEADILSSEKSPVTNDIKENNKTPSVPLCDSAEEKSGRNRPNISQMSRAIDNMIKKHSKSTENKNNTVYSKDVIDDKPSSPVSTSSKEDVALSVIRDKVIQKKKKKLKLKKLLKNKRLDIVENKNCKMNKPKVPLRDESQCLKEKLRKRKKKVKVGVSRNHWEVSIVEHKNNHVEVLYEDEPKPPVQSTNLLCQVNEPSKKFYCSLCDQKFESSYHLYEHQLTPEHKSKNTGEGEQQCKLEEESDPVKYCKSIKNIINDLEKRTLDVAKVMHHMKTTDPVMESVAEPSSSAREESWAQEWPVPQQEWSSRSTTPLWEGAPQTWEADNFSSGSLGSIIDTVNKLLSSDQEMLAVPGVSGYTWSDLQLAMGASDEEMAMLEQLGEHSLQEDYVYDNSRPAGGGEWPAPEDSPTFTDLDHQEQATLPATDKLQEVKKQEPLSDSEDSKACRGVIGRPRRLLGDYESREMVCPTCNKHFLGLPALQTHVAWSHCAPVGNSSRLMAGLKRRALLSSEEVDRRLVCFVCKEIVSSASLLESHIQAQHTKKPDEQEPPSKPVLTESAEKLKSKMSLALGGLVDRALNKLLGTNKPPPEPSTSHSQTTQDLNSGALQLLGRLCAARKRVGSENMKLSAEILQLLGRLRAASHKGEFSSRAYNKALAHEMRQILSRGRPIGVSKGALQASVNNSNAPSELKPTNLLDHLAVCSSDVQERPYACPICDLRFLIPSTRNRHIARAHGKYGRRYDEEVEENQVQDDLESGWKDSLDTGVEANDDGEMLPLCSDCGLSFQSIHEVMQHRVEDHPRRFSADGFQEDTKPSLGFDKHPIVESSSETQFQEPLKNDNVKMLPVSDNAIDSTSTVKKKRGRPPKVDLKTGQRRKLSEAEKKISPSSKSNRGMCRKKKRLEEVERQPESTDYYDDDMDSLDETSVGGIETINPDTDKFSGKLSDKHSNKNSSDENLAELSRKLDRRKVRMGNMAEDAVRVKAEAALRELNLPRKTKSPSSAAKWGINALKFTKHVPTNMSSSHVGGSPSKPRFASLVEKKWKMPAATAGGLQIPKTEIIDVKPDIYDFRDEELDTNKKPFQQFKESHFSEAEHSESNKLVQPINWNVIGSPKKTSQNSKLSSNSS